MSDGVGYRSIERTIENIVYNIYVPKEIILGTEFTYVISIYNRSKDKTVVKVDLREHLDKNFIFDSVVSSSGNVIFRDGIIFWSITDIKPETMNNIIIKVMPMKLGEMTNENWVTEWIEVYWGSGYITPVNLTVVDFSEELDNINSKFNIVDQNVDLLIEKFDGIKPSLIKDIKDEVETIMPLNGYKLTTGIVIKDFIANSLVVEIENRTSLPLDIKVCLVDYTKIPAKNIYKVLTIKGNSHKSYVLGEAPLEYEVIFEGIVEGVYAWTATRTNESFDSLSLSKFVASNTFSHDQLVVKND